MSTSSLAAPPEDILGHAVDESLIGRVLNGRYRLERVLGEGGVGVVYLAQHTRLGNPVAVKVLNQECSANRDVRRRFEREARALSSLSHPHIVAITDFGISEGITYLAMEYLDGRTLADLLHAKEKLPIERALSIGRQVLRGLAYAHLRGVLHRDLKPANVFLQSFPDFDLHVKLLDFGLAKILASASKTTKSEPTLTRNGVILGTPAYMAPEQASGAQVDLRADVYSAGVLLFELITGRCPFVAPNYVDVIHAHMFDPVPRLSDVQPQLVATPELDALIARAMAKDAAERFANGADMLAALVTLPHPAVSYLPSAALSAPATRQGDTTSVSAPPPAFVEKALRSAALQQPSSATTPTLPRDLATPLPTRTPYHGRRRRLSSAFWLAFAALVAAIGVGLMLSRDSRPSRRPSITRAGKSSDSTAARSSADAKNEAEPTVAEADPGKSAARKSAASKSATAKPNEAGAVLAEFDAFAAPLPARLQSLVERLQHGKALSRGDRRKIRSLLERRPNDARAAIWLARDSMNSADFADALTHYELALRSNPAVRADKIMLADLLRLATSSKLGERTARLLVHDYGALALREAQRAAADPELSSLGRSRLNQLVAQLEGG